MDRKRVPIPPPYRAEFATGGFVTTGIGPFLVLHTKESWEEACSAVEAVSIETEEGSDVHRDFFGYAAPISPDGQGRVQLTDDLIDHAGLGHEILVVGIGARLEIWDKSTYEARVPRSREARRNAVGRTNGSQLPATEDRPPPEEEK